MNNSAPIPQGAPSFDMRVWFYIHIDKLITHNTEAALRKDTEGWYRGLEALSGKLLPLISISLRESFQKDLEEIYQLVYNASYQSEPAKMLPEQRLDWIKNYTKLLTRLRQYDNNLFTQLHEIGMLLPRKPDLTTITFGKGK